MLFKSSIFAQASGSLAGCTFSHNRGGQYVRNRSIPTNPNTPYQQAVRNYLKTLAAAWPANPDPTGWKAYADNVLRPGALGDPRRLTALNWYIAINTLRLQAGLTVAETAPIVFSMATLAGTTKVLPTTTAPDFDVQFDNTDAWANTTGGALAVFLSPPLSTARLFHKSPYRFLGRILGNTTTPPTSPATFTGAYPYTAICNVAWRIVAINADGRISSPLSGMTVSI